MHQDTLVYNTLLNALIFTPALGILLVLALPARLSKYVSFAVTLVALLMGAVLYGGYLNLADVELQATTGDGFAFSEAYVASIMGIEGIFQGYDIKFITGLDGISIYLLLLTVLLFPLSIWYSWGSVTKHEKAYYALLLLLMTGVLGVFAVLDLVFFYIFFELGLIPMFFLIGIWGGKDRIYATVKFVLYTLAGSFLLLIALIYLGFEAGALLPDVVFTSDLYKLQMLDIPYELQYWLFLAFAISFAIKVPLFPLHTWLPDAHVQAPTAGSVILAGVLLKMGTYGLVRFCLPLFPEASMEFAPLFGTLGLIGIIYGAMAAMVQPDIKKLVAYSSVAHMGFVIMGIFAMEKTALSGAVIQMVNHGISTGALFLLVGMVYDRRHTRLIADYQGIAKVMPTFTVLFMIATFSSIGLPGLNGFVGEFLILLGSYNALGFSHILTVIATTGVILAAVYMLWMFRRVFFGELDKDANRALKDLSTQEVLVLMPLIALMFIIGFYATPFLEEINQSVNPLVDFVAERATLLNLR